MAGLTAQGFQRKRLDEIKTDLENTVKAQFGNDIDFSDSTVAAQLIGVLSLPLSELWEQAENTYLSQSPAYAEGVQLDEVAALNGVTRLDATTTNVQAIVYGDDDVVIIADSQARNSINDDIYTLDSAVTLNDSAIHLLDVSVATVADSTDYTITLNGNAYTFNSPANATATVILTGLKSAIDASAEPVTTSLTNDVLRAISDSQSTTFTHGLTANLTLENIGNVATFRADTEGGKLLPANALTDIVTAISGWRGIVNPYPADVGRDRESDTELRSRRLLSVSFAATSTLDAIFSKLLGISDVDDAAVYVNNTDTTDVNSIPPQHIYAVLKGGSDADIAKVLFDNTAVGIGQFGSTSINVTASNGQTFTQKFDRATETRTYISVDVSETQGFPTNGTDQIKDALIAHFAERAKIGEDIIYTRLYTPINSIPGHEINSLNISTTSPASGTVNLTASIAQIYTLSKDDITVTVT